MSSMSSGGDSRASSFASEAQPFMHGSFGSHMPQSFQMQQQAGGYPGGMPPTSHSLAGQAAQFLHWNQPQGYNHMHSQPPQNHHNWM
eukprot:UN0995